MIPAERDAYLRRIGLDDAPPATLSGLATLMTAHLHTVPFENLGIQLGHGVTLDPDHLFDKIVRRRRGGYCYELNGMFGRLLDALGFTRRPVSARVWYRDPPETPGLTHTLNVVTLAEGEVLADVGFGGTTARGPVPFKEGAEVTDADGAVRLRAYPPHGVLLERETPAGWQPQFSTDGREAYPADAALGSHFMSTHPSSHFVTGVVVGLFAPEGRDGLVGRTLTVRRGWETEQRVLNDDEVRTALTDRFGLDLGAEEDALIGRLPPLRSHPAFVSA